MLDLSVLDPVRNTEDGFFLGRFVADRLRVVAQSLPPWLPEGGQLRTLSGVIAAKSNRKESQHGLSRAAFGFVGTNPIYAGLTPNFQASGGLAGDGLRLLVLLYASLTSPTDAAAKAESLHKLIKDWDGRIDLVPQGDIVLAYLRQPTEEARRRATLALDETFEAIHPAKAKRRDVNLIFTKVHDALVQGWRRRPAHPRKSDVSISKSPVEGTTSYLEDVRGAQADVSDDSRDDLGRQRRGGRHSGYLRHRGLQPGLDNSLSLEEGRALTARLLPELPAVGGRIGDRPAAAAINLLALVTSKGFKDLYDNIAAYREGEPSWFVLKGGQWFIRLSVPGSHRHAGKTLPQEIRDLASPLVDFAFPDELQAPLHAILSQESDIPSWDTAAKALAALLADLRKVGSPRVTEGRIRMSMPVSCFAKTMDPCDAMALGGDSYGQSPAPLAYYARRYSQLAALRRELLEPLGFTFTLQTLEAGDADCMIGAPLAAVDEQVIHRLVASLHARVNVADSQGSATTCNALTQYAAWLWLAATGHRGFETIIEVTLRAIDPRGWVAMMDKPSDSGPGIRLCVLPAMLVTLLGKLREWRQHNIKNLPERARARIRASNLGDDSLFLLIEPDGRCRELTPGDMSLPEGYPRNTFRSRLRRILLDGRVWPRLVYAQIGHVWNGFGPFDSHSIEAVHQARACLANRLDEGLLADGWSIPSVLADVPVKPWPIPDIREGFEAHWRSFMRDLRKRWKAERRATLFRHTAEQKNEHAAWVQSALEDAVPGYCDDSPPTGFDVHSSQMERWLASAAERFPDLGRVEVCLRKLRAKLVHLRSRYDWAGDLSPLVFQPPPVAPPVTEHHVRAGRLAQAIRNHLLAPDVEPPDISERARWARLAGLLLLDHVVSDRSQLHSCLVHVSTYEVVPHPSDPILSLAEVSVSEQSPAPDAPPAAGVMCRAVRLSQAATVLARSLHGCPVPKLAQVEKDLRTLLQAKFKNSPSSPVRLLKSVAWMASRIEIAGVEWAAKDRCDPGTLSLARTSDFIRDQIGSRSAAAQDAPEGPSAEVLISNLSVKTQAERYLQYKRLRRGLWDLTEPGPTGRGIPRARYSRARKLCSGLWSNPDGRETHIFGVFRGIASRDQAREAPWWGCRRSSPLAKDCFGIPTGLSRRLAATVSPAGRAIRLSMRLC